MNYEHKVTTLCSMGFVGRLRHALTDADTSRRVPAIGFSCVVCEIQVIKAFEHYEFGSSC